MKKHLSTGLLAGFLLAGPLVSVLFLFHIAEGTPFIPFDFFDGLACILPGRLVTAGIETMVRVLMFLGFSLRSSSKAAEQIQAIAIFLGFVPSRLRFFLRHVNKDALRQPGPRALSLVSPWRFR